MFGKDKTVSKMTVGRAFAIIFIVAALLLGLGFVGASQASAATPTTAQLQATISSLKAQNAKLKEENLKLKAALAKEQDKKEYYEHRYYRARNSFNAAYKDACEWHWKYLGLKKKWTPNDLRWAVAYRGKKQGLSSSELTWLKNAAVDIVFIGAKESGGNTQAKNGQHLGMFQWNSAWSGTKAQKLNGTWNVSRFVKVYKDGGKSAIKRHWAATYGR